MSKSLLLGPLLTNSLKLNVVAFSTDDSGDELLPEREGPWVQVASEKELLGCYEGWGPDAVAMLKSIKNPSRWAIHTLYPPLSTYVRGRVALVGDAVS